MERASALIASEASVGGDSENVYLCMLASGVCMCEHKREKLGGLGIFYIEAYFFLNPHLCFCLCWPMHVKYWIDPLWWECWIAAVRYIIC